MLVLLAVGVGGWASDMLVLLAVGVGGGRLICWFSLQWVLGVGV